MQLYRMTTFTFFVMTLILAETMGKPLDESTKFQLDIPTFQDNEITDNMLNEVREVQKIMKKPTNIEKKHFIKNKPKEDNKQHAVSEFDTEMESPKSMKNFAGNLHMDEDQDMTMKEARDEVVGCKLCKYEDHKYHKDKYDYDYGHHNKHGHYDEYDDHHSKHHDDYHGKYDDHSDKYDDYSDKYDDHHGKLGGYYSENHDGYGDDKGKEDDSYIPVYIYGRQSAQSHPDSMMGANFHHDLSQGRTAEELEALVGCKHDEYGYDKFDKHHHKHKYDYYDEDYPDYDEDYPDHDSHYRGATHETSKNLPLSPFEEKLQHNHEDDVVGCKHDEYGYDKHDHKHKKHHDDYDYDSYGDHEEYGYRNAEEIEEVPMHQRHMIHLGMNHNDDTVGCKHDEYGYEKGHHKHHKFDDYEYGYSHGHGHGGHGGYEKDDHDEIYGHGGHGGYGKGGHDEIYGHGGHDGYGKDGHGHGGHGKGGYDADAEYGYVDQGHKNSYGYGRSADAMASDISNIMSEISKVQSNIREVELSMAHNKNKMPMKHENNQEIVGDWPEILKKPYLGLIPAKKFASYGDDYDDDYAPKIHLPKFPYKLDIPYKKLEIPYKKLEIPYKKLDIPYKKLEIPFKKLELPKLELPYKIELPYKKLELPYKKPESSNYGEDLKHLLYQPSLDYESDVEDHKAPAYEDYKPASSYEDHKVPSYEPLYGQTAYNNEHYEQQSQMPAQKGQYGQQDNYGGYSIPSSGEFGYPILNGNAPSHSKAPPAPSYTNVY